MFNYTLLLKDGSRDYIINEGKVYYLLNKSCSFIPKEVKDSLLGGDTTEYSKYTRLEDVYGITKDLKVYYCSSGMEGAFGAVENYDIDPNASATGINGNSNIKTALTDILSSQYGITVDSEKGVTLANASVLRNLELDGTKYSGITDINALGDLKNLKSLTLSNLSLTSLSGLEGIPGLNYLYLKNTTVGDYTALASCINLQKLYLYLPSTINETTANNQVLYLGQGLKDASGLTKLKHFGISGDTVMYNDSVSKNTNNPVSYTGTNKLVWTSANKSNVTTLGQSDGTNKTGLYAFNDTIKNSLQYVYLNNNSFSSLGALSEFSGLTELQLMCNSSLSNIDGLSNHSNLTELTLHNCALTSIAKLTGCNALTKLSVQNNSGLTSLAGIDGATNMIYLIANNCSITNIDSLANHSKIIYLNLANNTNLESVKYIQHCKDLNYVYLDNNTKMASTEVEAAFNGTDKNIGETALIKNVKNGYANIPKSYWDLFTSTATVLDWSYATLGEYLNVNSAKWVKLKGRTDVIKLKLDGQTQLKMEDSTINGITYYGIDSTLKTLSGMKALSLNGCTQVNSIGFVEPKYSGSGSSKILTSGMPSLYEIDIRSVSSTLTDLSVINNSISINRLIINNTAIDATKIQQLVSRFRMENATNDQTWNSVYGYSCSGLCAVNCAFPDFSNCSSITNFCGACQGFDVTTARTVDLTGTKIVTLNYRTASGVTFKLPSTCSEICVDPYRSKILILQKKSNLKFLEGNNWLNQVSIDSLESQGLSNCTFVGSRFDEDVSLGNGIMSAFTSFSVTDSYNDRYVDFKKITKPGSITTLTLTGLAGIKNFSNISYLTTLSSLNLSNDRISNISGISSLVNLTTLDLSNNSITDISQLSTLENLTTLNLYGNNITNLTPLVSAIGSDNHIGYTVLDIRENALDGYTVVDNITALLKLHAAGLTKIQITGNNFSENEINELKNGKTVTNSDGTKTTYQGFGGENVIN